MPIDNEIARPAVLRPIAEVAEEMGLGPGDYRLYGTDVAKVDPAVLTRRRRVFRPSCSTSCSRS